MRKVYLFLILGVHNVVKLVLHDAGVGAHNGGSISVKILCLFLQLHALDAIQIFAGSAEGAVIVGPQGTCDFSQSPRFLHGLPQHAEAFSVCTETVRGICYLLRAPQHLHAFHVCNKTQTLTIKLTLFSYFNTMVSFFLLTLIQDFYTSYNANIK